MQTDPQVPSPAADVAGRRTLTGWKEIATHFDKGVRTVQRWEEELSLPVRRIKTGRGDTVYAFVDELEAWRDGHVDDGLGSGPAGDTSPKASHAEGSGAPRATTRRYGAFVLAAMGMLGLVLATASRSSFRLGRTTDQGESTGERPAAAVAQPASWTLDVDTLRVFDAAGRFLWAFRFEGPPAAGWEGGGPARHPPRIRIEDLDGDGNREVVLAFIPAEPRFSGSTLWCFDHRGRARFTHRPGKSVRFGDRTYSPPWEILDVFFSLDRPERRMLFVTWTHVQSGDFPCLLEKLSPDGAVESEFWSAGFISSVTNGAMGGRPSIFVGAANNESGGTSLAVFDADSVRGAAPATTSDKTCRDCPPGWPRTFIVFPRLEFKRLVGGFPFVTQVRQQSTGELRVFIDQSYEPEWPATQADVHYDLDAGFVPNKAEVGDRYLASHERLRAEGVLDHQFGESDARELWPVLMYDDSRQRFVPFSGRTATPTTLSAAGGRRGLGDLAPPGTAKGPK
jgi:hypothetical protein